MATIASGTFSANGNSSEFNITHIDGSASTVLASGDFGGGTLTLQISPDSGTTWINSGSDGQLTAAGFFKYEFTNAAKSGQLIGRLNLAGATSPDVDYWVV